MQAHGVAQPAELTPVATKSGHVVWVPALTIEAIASAGGETLEVEITPTEKWLTVTEAAKEHASDIDGMTFSHAKVAISRAATQGGFKSRGTGRSRLIDPVSLRAWRLQQRERNLDSLE